MPDWADKEAAELVAFVKEFGDADALNVVAARLRVVRCLGVADGIDNVSRALDEAALARCADAIRADRVPA